MRQRRGGGRDTRWSAEELVVLDRHVRGVLTGRHTRVSDAARACSKDLRRLVPRARGRPRRSCPAVYLKILAATRGRRRSGMNTEWSDGELKVLERYVRRLKRGEFPDAQSAAPVCYRELMRRWRGLSPARRGPVPRTEQAALSRLYARARVAGWRRRMPRWSDSENAVLDRHVDALLRGVYPNTAEAGHACWEEVRRAGRKDAGRAVRRTVSAVTDRLVRRATERGWLGSVSRWLPEERRILDRHAGMMVPSRNPGLAAVARRCRAELYRLHRRLKRQDPAAFARIRPRTPLTLKTYVIQRARALGRRVAERWHGDETRIVDRFARELVRGRLKDAPTAASLCRRELLRLRRGWRETDPARYRRTKPRPPGGVYSRLVRQAHAQGRCWSGTRWTPRERAALRRAVDWYARNRGIRSLKPATTAVEGLQLELEQLGSLRTLGACRQMFWKERRLRFG
ncbi:MAG: hypothetical protein JSU73_01900 [candidate division WOR-3 bacterium]|nr:MAG: hypothetical protein JSU73_01900 [candidate division WOR-3 bacterium]